MSDQAKTRDTVGVETSRTAFLATVERIQNLISEKRRFFKTTKTTELFSRVNLTKAKFEGLSLAFALLDAPVGPVASTSSSSTPIVSTTLPMSANESSTTTISQPSTSNHSVRVSLFTMLRDVKLPNFNGDLKRWRSFYQQMDQFVFKPNAPAIEKYIILNNHLQGAAKRAIEGFEITEENFEPALKLLLERYGDPTKLVNTYYSELQALPQRFDGTGQRENLDAIRKILNNLKGVGTTINQEYLQSLIMSKFSRETLRVVLKQLVKAPGDKFTIDELIEALNGTVSTDELVETFLKESLPDFSSPTPKKKKLAASLVGGTSKACTTSNSSQCVYCDADNHASQDCRRFRSLKTRRDRLAKRKICFSCLIPGHTISDCTKRGSKCSFCHRPGHNLALCVPYIISTNHPPQPESQPQHQEPERRESSRPNRRAAKRKPGTAAMPSVAKSKGTFLETFSCYIKLNYETLIPVRGVFDSCSQFSYITFNLAKRIGSPIRNPTTLNLCLFGTLETLRMDSGEISVTLVSRNRSNEKTLNFMVTEHITGDMVTSPPPSFVQRVLPQHLTYADPEIFIDSTKRIEIIIGNNYQFNFLTGEIRRISPYLVLRQSFFGWIPTGSIKNDVEISRELRSLTLSCSSSRGEILDTHPKSNFVDEKFDLNLALNNLWSLEILGIKNSELDEIEDFVLKNFRDTVRFEENRFVVRWPWKQENPTIPTNFRMCMARLKSLFLRSSKDLIMKYNQTIMEQLNLGIIEYAPKSTPFTVHYLPHRAIERNEKLRIVYDASAKTKSSPSLNDSIHPGPVLLEDLVGLILNFRLHPVGLTADIEKAFLQVGLNEVDRDVVRFLWVKNPNEPPSSENLSVFRFCRVPFGVIASPFLLNMVLQELLTTEPRNENYELAKKRFYVDNLVVSVNNTNSAINLYNSITKKLATASFNLRGWTSNDPNFLRAIGASPLSSQDEKISILGMNWNRLSNCLSIKFDPLENCNAITKRLALKFYASIFDPLGVIGPSTLRLKLFIQECWRNKFDWDTPLPPNFVAKWSKLYSESLDILNIEIPRPYWPQVEAGIISLHVFCDASKDAYACAAYLAYENVLLGVNTCSLIYAKTRAAPKNLINLKEHTTTGTPASPATIRELSIPRLELMAVLIGKRVATFLISKLDLTVKSTFLWTDATTILQWLNSSAIQPKFVQNRLNEIRKTPNLVIRHVPTDTNPADIASRGMKSSMIKNSELWWKGPSWLPYENLWPSTPDTTSIFVSPISTLVSGISKQGDDLILTDELESHFHLWTAYIRLFKNMYYFGRKTDPANPPSLVEKFKNGERLLIRALQRKYFAHEYELLKKGIQPNFQLDLYLDQDDLIRCYGRLEKAKLPLDTIHPILLPRKSPIVGILLRKIHAESCHMGCNYVLSKLRERFWIPKCRALIKSVIHRCVACRRWEGGSYRLPPMPPLPLVRVAEAAPFLHTGVDYFGPVHIKDAKGDEQKAYVALFVCLVTRGVHLEPARDMSGYEFLLCLTRFAARRRTPKFMISDNGTNFTFVQPLVGKLTSTSDYRLDNYLTSNNIEWSFIPAYSPWQGGVYERLVGIVKSSLKKTYGLESLDYTEFCTALCKIEDVVNDRPLTYLSSDDLESALTPNHFLKIGSANVNASVEVTNKPLPSTTENLLIGWRSINAVVDTFWEIFHSRYLTTLRERHTSLHHPVKGSIPFLPKENDIVLVKEPSAPRAEWSVGIVQKLDRRQALAHVRHKGRTILRSINLVPFRTSYGN